MAVVNHDKKWIYLMEPHTASRAVADVLTSKLGGSQVGHHHIGLDELFSRTRNHLDRKRASGYDVIVTIRDPLDVLTTKWYYTGKTHNSSFSDWVNRNLDHPTLIKPLSGLYTSASHFVYYERLDEDLSTTFNTKVEVPVNPKHVTKDKKHWSQLLTDVDIALLTDRFREFLYGFGYVYEGYRTVLDPLVHRRLVKRVSLP